MLRIAIVMVIDLLTDDMDPGGPLGPMVGLFTGGGDVDLGALDPAALVPAAGLCAILLVALALHLLTGQPHPVLASAGGRVNVPTTPIAAWRPAAILVAIGPWTSAPRQSSRTTGAMRHETAPSGVTPSSLTIRSLIEKMPATAPPPSRTMRCRKPPSLIMRAASTTFVLSLAVIGLVVM